MTTRTWQTSTALRRNAYLATDELLLIADQGSHLANAMHAEAVEQLIRERRAPHAAHTKAVAVAAVRRSARA